MEIEFRRSGGFAGVRQPALALNTDDLPEDERDEIKALINESQFFQLPAPRQRASRGADRFQYMLTIKDGERAHTVALEGGNIPDNVQPLINRLTKMARERIAG